MSPSIELVIWVLAVGQTLTFLALAMLLADTRQILQAKK